MRYIFNHLNYLNYLKAFTPINFKDILTDAQPLFNNDNELENIFKVNHHLAKLHLEGKKREDLNFALVEGILKTPLPNPIQQANNLIRLLAEFDREITFKWIHHFNYYTGSQHPMMFKTLMEYLNDHKWARGDYGDPHRQGGVVVNVMLTIQGWERFAQLQQDEISSPGKSISIPLHSHVILPPPSKREEDSNITNNSQAAKAIPVIFLEDEYAPGCATVHNKKATWMCNCAYRLILEHPMLSGDHQACPDCYKKYQTIEDDNGMLVEIRQIK